MSNNKDFFRPFPISKDTLDTLNSVAWFLADACWMLGLMDLGLGLMIPTVITGLFLLYVEKRRHVFMINAALNSWICMNFLWMFADMDLSGPYLLLAKTFFGLGLLFIVLAMILSPNLKDTFSHFRRFRGIKDT